jgi:hypothetical protein
MMKLLTIATIFASLSATVAAKADTYSYLCSVGGKSYSLKVDEAANSLEWRGAKYKVSQIACGRHGWHAEGNGTSFDFCTATNGYADIEKDGKLQFQCNIKRAWWPVFRGRRRNQGEAGH